MKNFKQRVQDLLAVTTNEDVRLQCGKVAELQGYMNESALRDVILDGLKGVSLSKEERKFVALEKKLSVLEDMGLSSIFPELYENNIIQLNPQITYPLNALHEAFKNKTATRVLIAQKLVETLSPYTFNPIVEKNVNTLNKLMENYAEDIVVINAIDKISRMRTGQFFKAVVEKLENYLLENDNSKRKELISELQKFSYESLIQETVKNLIKFEDAGVFHIVSENSNYNVKPIYSFIYFDPELKEKYFFSNLGQVYMVNENKLTRLNEREISELPRTFLEMNEYIQRPNVRMNSNSILINLANTNIEFVVNESGNEAYLNNMKIDSTEPYQYLIKTGLFGGANVKELQTIAKMWENLNILVEMDFGKNIISKVNPTLYTSIYKLDEQFYVHTKNLLAQHDQILENLNGLQARNIILEFMKFDITESLYEYLEGPEAEIAKLKADQKIIESDIKKITEQIAKIDSAMMDPMVGQADELVQVREAMIDEIEFLKGKYHEISEDIKSIASGKPILEFEADQELKVGDGVKIKGTGLTGTVTAINTVTKSLSVLTDEGDTIDVAYGDVDKIDDTIAKNLDQIEKKAKDAEKVEVAEGNEEEIQDEQMTEGQKLFGHLKRNIK